MKKFLAGLLIGAVLFVPLHAKAYLQDKQLPWANDLYQFHDGCPDNDSSTHNDTCGRVSVMDDADNKCYVAWSVNDTSSSISCVKRGN